MKGLTMKKLKYGVLAFMLVLVMGLSACSRNLAGQYYAYDKSSGITELTIKKVSNGENQVVLTPVTGNKSQAKIKQYLRGLYDKYQIEEAKKQAEMLKDVNYQGKIVKKDQTVTFKSQQIGTQKFAGGPVPFETQKDKIILRTNKSESLTFYKKGSQQQEKLAKKFQKIEKQLIDKTYQNFTAKVKIKKAE
ncbi:hypothetical protein FC40_GL001155 [Ligilactobacillus hayakitensis DSM 18933 = JCM 14209]|uniref:Lipoprotein n=2 Tax=Ligilactobacillus TaxID=2767887 RepID=A0A0R1WZ57_9LACO|nr:hypothetical protein FC40_GL001155 [Ligilactobacillus hayakitensis DSM 18933 = JCM 14209]